MQNFKRFLNNRIRTVSYTHLYEAFDQKLSLLGALIEKVSDEKEIQKFTLKVS